MRIRLLLAAGILGCASRAPGVTTAPEDTCVHGGNALADDTVTIVVEEAPVPARAPVPTNQSERLVFRQSYATLVRLDCTGATRPGLAAEWASDGSGAVWTFRLHETSLPGGTSLTATDVVASWAQHGLADRRPWLAEVRAASAHEVVVTLTTPAPDGPVALADAAVAVGIPRPGAPEPTAGFRMESDSISVAIDGSRVLRWRAARGADLRDLLAQGADLLVTDAPAVITYARGLPQFEVTPLPWSRTYLLVSPTAPPLDTGPDSASRSRFRAGLARDAVRIDARAAGAATPAIAFACRTGYPPVAAPARRVAYPSSDTTARALAERIVALSRAGLVVAGLDDRSLRESLQEGRDAAYILSFPIADPASCREFPPVPSGTTVEPLVDTREHLILRRGAVRVSVDGDGMPRILP